MKRMLLIHDLCSVGKAAMMNMIPVLSVMGIEVCPLPTMLLSYPYRRFRETGDPPGAGKLFERESAAFSKREHHV